MKIILFSFFLILSFESKAMFALYTSYWSGCMKSRHMDLGKTYGKSTSFCKKKAKKREYAKLSFEQPLIVVEESRFLFYKGCIDGNVKASEKDLYEKCHILTKNFHNDT